MASAPSASWNLPSITHLASYPSRSLSMNSSNESPNYGDFFSTLISSVASQDPKPFLESWGKAWSYAAQPTTEDWQSVYHAAIERSLVDSSSTVTTNGIKAAES